MLIINIIHWASLGLSVIISFIIFRDLADVSQWVVKTPRSTVMNTFKRRHIMAGVYVMLTLVAIATYAFRGVGVLWVLVVVIIVSALLFYMGYFNPSFMMRAQRNSTNYYSISDAKKHIHKSTSLIVMETKHGVFGHTDEGLLRPHVASPEESKVDDVVMTYCGLTNMGIAYKPKIKEKTLDLAPMTQLENNLVMWDKNSGKTIQQFIGTFYEDEDSKTEKMPEWPTYRMPFWAYEKAFPAGKVFLNPIIKFRENPVLYIYDTMMHFLFTDSFKKQAKSEEPVFPTIERFDDRLHNKTKIYGVNIGDDYVAYTKEFIVENEGLLNAEIGGQKIVIAYHEDYDSVGMYANPKNEKIESIAFGGHSNIGKLCRVPTMKSQAYWMVWQNFFPNTAVNRI